MAQGYGQYCPLALATELLCQRWTMLIVSRLIDGCTGFNDIHRGVPRISPALLSKRLNELEQHGILTRRKLSGKQGYAYIPTKACHELESVIDLLAVWGQHWARDMSLDDLDPGFLAWSMHLRLNTEAMPAGRTVMQFEFTGTPSDCRRFWLVNTDGTVDMCMKHPGFETDLLIEADILTFVEAWRGFTDLRQAIRVGKIRLSGPSSLTRRFPDWLLLSALAPHKRQCNGQKKATPSADSQS